MDVAASAAAFAAQSRAAAEPPDARRARAESLASDFEAVFLGNYLKTMFEGIGEDPLTGGGSGSENWKELLVEEYGKAFAARGGIGLAAPIADQLLKIQEMNPQ